VGHTYHFILNIYEITEVLGYHHTSEISLMTYFNGIMFIFVLANSNIRNYLINNVIHSSAGPFGQLD
jgi:hypothetical protein